MIEFDAADMAVPLLLRCIPPGLYQEETHVPLTIDQEENE